MRSAWLFICSLIKFMYRTLFIDELDTCFAEITDAGLNHHAASSHLSLNCWHCLFSYIMKIILEPIKTIQVESFSSENSTLLHFFFQCILSFAKHKCSTLCFVVNEGFFFNFSLLIFLQDSWTRRTLEILTLTLDFSIICFVNCLRWSWKRVELRVGSYTQNCSLITIG